MTKVFCKRLLLPLGILATEAFKYGLAVVSLANANAYDERYQRWNMNDLSIIPGQLSGTQAEIKTIRQV